MKLLRVFLKIHFIIRFVIVYFCVYLIKTMRYGINQNGIFIDIIMLIAVSILAMIFTYGVISLIDDFRYGGWNLIKNKFRHWNR